MVDLKTEVFERPKQCKWCFFYHEEDYYGDTNVCWLLQQVPHCPKRGRRKDCPLPPKWKIVEVKDE
jgi:hypothetical protein